MTATAFLTHTLTVDWLSILPSAPTSVPMVPVQHDLLVWPLALDAPTWFYDMQRHEVFVHAVPTLLTTLPILPGQALQFGRLAETVERTAVQYVGADVANTFVRSLLQLELQAVHAQALRVFQYVRSRVVGNQNLSSTSYVQDTFGAYVQQHAALVDVVRHSEQGDLQSMRQEIYALMQRLVSLYGARSFLQHSLIEMQVLWQLVNKVYS